MNDVHHPTSSDIEAVSISPYDTGTTPGKQTTMDMTSPHTHDTHTSTLVTSLRRFLLALTLLFALGSASLGAAGQITVDADADGLMDEQELQLGTDPNRSDTDIDRLSDGFEVREFGTDPLRADSDEDGLGDGDELEVFRTDPLTADTDGDGFDDATEIDAGSDPRDAASAPDDLVSHLVALLIQILTSLL